MLLELLELRARQVDQIFVITGLEVHVRQIPESTVDHRRESVRIGDRGHRDDRETIASEYSYPSPVPPDRESPPRLCAFGAIAGKPRRNEASPRRERSDDYRPGPPGQAS